jgi:hypothetical protein
MGVSAPTRQEARRIPGGPSRAVLPSLYAQWYYGDNLVFWIDPKLLRRRLLDRVSADGADIWLSDRFLDGGDWSEVIRPIEQLAEHRDMLELVAFGPRYPDMPVFGELASRIRSGRPPKRYGKVLDTEDKLHAYFRYFLQLTESIRDRGFQEQSKLPAQPPEGRDVRGKWAARQRNNRGRAGRQRLRAPLSWADAIAPP